MSKKLQRKIEKKLNKLQELLEKAQEVQVIEPDNPETWDPDTLYDLVEQLKEALALLEDQKSKKLDEFGDPVILEEGLCSLVDDYQNEEEETEEND